jgi:hypothetical protein
MAAFLRCRLAARISIASRSETGAQLFFILSTAPVAGVGSVSPGTLNASETTMTTSATKVASAAPRRVELKAVVGRGRREGEAMLGLREPSARS